MPALRNPPHDHRYGGWVFDNSSATLTFDPTTFTATATELKVLGTSVEWKGAFPIKATGPHGGEKLTL